MPTYKYKAHRRKSFEPADSLGLPLVSCSLLADTDGTAQAGHCYSTRRKENLRLIPLAGFPLKFLIWVTEIARKAIGVCFSVHTFV